MTDLLISTLETLECEVYRQGSMTEDQEYPASFFTFWNVETESKQHFNNSANTCIWEYDVNFYSNAPEKVLQTLEKAIEKLKENGFIVSGKGHDVASDEPTHTGRGIEIMYIERTEKS